MRSAQGDGAVYSLNKDEKESQSIAFAFAFALALAERFAYAGC